MLLLCNLYIHIKLTQKSMDLAIFIVFKTNVLIEASLFVLVYFFNFIPFFAVAKHRLLLKRVKIL